MKGVLEKICYSVMKYIISVITVKALLKQKDHLLRPSHKAHLGEIFSSYFSVNLSEDCFGWIFRVVFKVGFGI